MIRTEVADVVGSPPSRGCRRLPGIPSAWLAVRGFAEQRTAGADPGHLYTSVSAVWGLGC